LEFVDDFALSANDHTRAFCVNSNFGSLRCASDDEITKTGVLGVLHQEFLDEKSFNVAVYDGS
jgi:hypothetical protein